MVLYLIGLGLGDEKDITIRGLEVVRRSSRVYLENYTSLLATDKLRLESFFQCPLFDADRNFVEQTGVDEMVDLADGSDISFLVIGDPLSATTHTDLILRARKRNIHVQIIHNASIFNAVSQTGLQLYRFGQTVTIPLWTSNWRPDSFYDKIIYNIQAGLHTLCLVDLKIKEQSEENLRRGRMDIFEPPCFMTIQQAISQLLKIQSNRDINNIICGNTLGIGVARLGQEDQIIKFGTLDQLKDIDFGKPLHSLIICGDLHDMELEYAQLYSVNR